MGDLSTPAGSQTAKAAGGLSKVQKLQMALHAKAKAEAGYRFYALYDKIYREDVLAQAYVRIPMKSPTYSNLKSPTIQK